MKVTDLLCLSSECAGSKKKPQEKTHAQSKEGNDLERANFKQYATPYNRNADGIETFEDFVKQHGRQCEIERHKKAEQAHKTGALRRFCAVLTSCAAQPKVQEPTFWIDAAPGYPERRVPDL